MIIIADRMPRNAGTFLVKPITWGEVVRIVDADNGGQVKFAVDDLVLLQNLTQLLGQVAKSATWGGSLEEREQMIHISPQGRFTLVELFYEGQTPGGKKLL